ncbi:unnamed protein product [Aureobasidium mustum]|uniref:DNA (cytosine-5-)-methyltransferase n=1 Tax=Aureobasidium mustum TaxID=2773714 RepID=A0A9N8JVW4_9PEZI|nr:unnamed protein product [Aureobasidium mustum]
MTSEREAINALAVTWNSKDRSSQEHNIWQLNQFSIYRKGSDHRHAYELCPLQSLKTESGVNDLLFDGILSVDGQERFVQGVSFECLAMEGYGDEGDTVSACIQTVLACKANVWYELRTPASQYLRYHHSEQPVTLSLFRRSFYPYLMQKYGSSSAVNGWLAQHPSHDFGQAFCANLGFIIKEVYSVNDQLLQQPIFGETDTKQLKAIHMEKTAYDTTVVTPFVFELFHKMPFRGQMQVLPEPAIIRGFNLRSITLQVFVRCGRDLDDKQAAPNQLALSDEFLELDPDYVTRHCRVAAFASLKDIQAPYDRDGAGDLWYVISSSAPTWTFIKHEIAADSKLKGMGIFCGSGSFDRGLEEGGGLEFKWAVDWAERALHSYRANNVIGMARNPSNAKDLNVFSQVLCCLVSMGYQVQQLLMDPGNYGSCQSRQRIFIIATAPGHKAPAPPPQTHTCSELETHARAIGYASNGLPFGKRRYDVCPFVSLTAEGAFQDLPIIGDSHVQTCIAAPDHRTCRHESSKKRALIQMVPRWPYGQGFVQAVAKGKMSKNAMATYAWQNKNRASASSRSWARIYPDRLVGCLTTDIKPHDSFLGRTLHYDQHRTMSVMEARRVQGLPDHEVILGTPSQQWYQIGNGVDRKVAFALGIQIANACRETSAHQWDITASLPVAREMTPLEIRSVVRHETPVRDPVRSAACEAPTTVAVIEEHIRAGGVVQQTCSGEVSVGTSVEVAVKSALPSQSLVQGVSGVPQQQKLLKGGIEYIIID